MEGIMANYLPPSEGLAERARVAGDQDDGKSVFSNLLASLNGAAGQVTTPIREGKPAAEPSPLPRPSLSTEESNPLLAALIQLLTYGQASAEQAVVPAEGQPNHPEETALPQLAPDIVKQLTECLMGKASLQGPIQDLRSALQPILTALQSTGDHPPLPQEWNAKLATLIAKLTTGEGTSAPTDGLRIYADCRQADPGATGAKTVVQAATMKGTPLHGVKAVSPQPVGAGRAVMAAAVNQTPSAEGTASSTATAPVISPAVTAVSGCREEGTDPLADNRKQPAASREKYPGETAASGDGLIDRLNLISGDKNRAPIEVAVQAEPLSADKTSHLIGQIVAQARMVDLNGGQAIRIRLKPDYLGDLNLLVSSERGVITAHFIAKSHLTAELIQVGLPQLREALHQQGISCQQLAVSVDNGQGNYPGGQPRPGRDGGGSYLPPATPPGGLAGIPERGLPSSAQSWPEAGLLNCTV